MTTYAEFESMLQDYLPTIQKGQVLRTNVLSAAKTRGATTGLWVNIPNAKSEGWLPASELPYLESWETGLFEIVDTESEEGLVVLSCRTALKRLAVQEALALGSQPVQVSIEVYTRGGFTVRLPQGGGAFLPWSQSYFGERPRSEDEVVGKTVTVRVLEAGPRTGVIVSHRKHVEELFGEWEKSKTRLELEITERRSMGVTGMVEGYKVFVPGSLLNRSTRDQLSKGEKILITLLPGRKPGQYVGKQVVPPKPAPPKQISVADMLDVIVPGTPVKGKIVSLTSFGLFVRLDGLGRKRVDGLVPRQALRGMDPERDFRVGERVEGVIVKAEADAKKSSGYRINLGIMLDDHWTRLAEAVEQQGSPLLGVTVKVMERVRRGVRLEVVGYPGVSAIWPKDMPTGDALTAYVRSVDPEKMKLVIAEVS